MQATTLKSLGKAILFSAIATTITNAEIQDKSNKENTLDTTMINTSYQSMTTAQLQKEVEKHSENGNLSFALGQELIKRWTKS